MSLDETMPGHTLDETMPGHTLDETTPVHTLVKEPSEEPAEVKFIPKYKSRS